MDFSTTPVDYVALVEIDTRGNNYTLTFTDNSTERYTSDTTEADGDSAEFIGFYRNDLARIQSISIDAINGDNEWAIDNLEYGTFETIHVDLSAKGNNDGTSWNDAFTDLKEALQSSGLHSRLLIAEGAYYPDTFQPTSNPVNSIFTIAQNSSQNLIGGFPEGGGTRDIENHRTILSGDIDQDDLPLNESVTESPDNITGENANQILNIGISPFRSRISGLTFSGATSLGLAVGQPSPGFKSTIISDCEFIGNQGLALTLRDFDQEGTGLTVLRSTFKNNHATSRPGIAIFSSPRITISQCEFSQNKASNNAGVRTACFRVATDNNISEVNILSDSSVSITDCLFESNTNFDDNDTGRIQVIEVINANFPSIDRCQFKGNFSTSPISAMSMILSKNNGRLTLSNSLFTGNKGEDLIRGEGPFLGQGVVRLAIHNCTIAANDLFTLYNQNGSNVNSSFIDIFNTISTTRIEPSFGQAVISLSHSQIAGETASSGGNIDPDIDPQFVAPRPAEESPTTLGNYRLRPTSPLIEIGNNSQAIGALDLAGLSRFQDGNQDGPTTVDIGAYEFDNAPTPQFPEITITDIFRASSGRVVLTVDSSLESPYIAQFNLGLTPSGWENSTTGTLSTGSNTIIIPNEELDIAAAKYFFRVVDQ